MKVRKILALCIAALLMITCLVTLAACGGDDTPDSTPQLAAPTLTKEGGELKWTIVENALSAADGGYTIKISKSGAADVLKTTGTGFSFNAGEGIVQTSIDGLATLGAYTFSVRANGDGENYTNSNWSNTITHTITETLSAPVLSLDNVTLIDGPGLYLKWEKIENAEYYELQYNESNEGETEVLTDDDYCYIKISDLFTLALDDEFRVRAVGDGTIYLTSGWSNIIIISAV